MSGEGGEILLPAPRPVVVEKSLGIGLFPSKPIMGETPVKETIWTSSNAMRIIVQVIEEF